MKTIIFILRWVIGIFVILFSIGGFIAEAYIMATIVLIIGIIITPIIGLLKTKNSENTVKKKNLNKANKNIVEKKASNNISENTTYTINIEIDEDELLKKINQENNEGIDIEDIVDFYGTEQFSRNKEYCIVYSDKELALIYNNKLVFKKRIKIIDKCYVSNSGISICCSYTDVNNLGGIVTIFDYTGKKIFNHKTTANIGTSGISDDGKIAIFETLNSNTNDANKIFIIDIKLKKITNEFEKVYSFVETLIDTEKKRIQLIDNNKFVYEIDYLGNQTNKDEYEKQILNKGSIYDKLLYYLDKPDEEKFQDVKYLEILNNSINDEDTKYSIGLDRIYRLIGEYYEANGNTELTIKNWENAIKINPKIGVKRKLDKLKNIN